MLHIQKLSTFDRRWQLGAHGQGGDGGVLSNQVSRMGEQRKRRHEELGQRSAAVSFQAHFP